MKTTLLFIAGCLCVQAVTSMFAPTPCMDGGVSGQGKPKRSPVEKGWTLDECKDFCIGDSLCTGVTYIVYSSASKNQCWIHEGLITQQTPASNRPTTLYRKIPCPGGCFNDLGNKILSRDEFTLKYVPEWYVHTNSKFECEERCYYDGNCVGYAYKFDGNHPAPWGCYLIPYSAMVDFTEVEDNPYVSLSQKTCETHPSTPYSCFEKRRGKYGRQPYTSYKGVAPDECKSMCVTYGQSACTGYAIRLNQNPKQNICFIFKDFIEERNDNSDLPTALFRAIPCGLGCMEPMGRFKPVHYTLKDHDGQGDDDDVWWIDAPSAALCAEVCDPHPTCSAIFFKNDGNHPAKLGCYMFPFYQVYVPEAYVFYPENFTPDPYVYYSRYYCGGAGP